MEFIINLFIKTLMQVWITFTHNWPFLVISVLIAVALKMYLDPQKISAFLIRYKRVGVIGATVAGVTTPLCSCGTTAIVLGMMASMMPWSPIIAFMVASPLTSPEELIYSAGLFGWPFAWAFFIASIILGLLGGLIGDFLEKRGLLANQIRFAGPAAAVRETTSPVAVPQPAAPLPAVEMAFNPRPSVINHPQPVRVNTALLAAAAPAGISGCCGPVEMPAVEFSAPAACGCGTTPAKASASSCGCGTASAKPAVSSCGCGGSPAGKTNQPVEEKPAGSCACSSPAASPEAAPRPEETRQANSCGCGSSVEPAAAPTCGCSGQPADQPKARVTWRGFAVESLQTGKRLLFMFLGFAFIGYFLNGLIPQAWVSGIFGAGNIYSVPLAATLGLPLYINTEASLPLVRALIDGGMSQGAALAFLITGAGTSIGALAGALTIARWRVIAVVVGTLWAGSIVMGYLYNLLLLSRLV